MGAVDLGDQGEEGRALESERKIGFLDLEFWLFFSQSCLFLFFIYSDLVLYFCSFLRSGSLLF